LAKKVNGSGSFEFDFNVRLAGRVEHAEGAPVPVGAAVEVVGVVDTGVLTVTGVLVVTGVETVGTGVVAVPVRH